MAASTFFLQRPRLHPDDARRHLGLLVRGLKNIAYVGWSSAAGCTFLALLIGRFLFTRPTQPGTVSDFQGLSAIVFVAWFMAIAMLVFSTLYFVSGFGLARQKTWAHYMASVTFMTKILLCLALGRISIRAMLVFLVISSWDFYGLWVSLSAPVAQLFSRQVEGIPESTQAEAKPVNLIS
jgi:hypothetical protein